MAAEKASIPDCYSESTSYEFEPPDEFAVQVCCEGLVVGGEEMSVTIRRYRNGVRHWMVRSDFFEAYSSTRLDGARIYTLRDCCQGNPVISYRFDLDSYGKAMAGLPEDLREFWGIAVQLASRCVED